MSIKGKHGGVLNRVLTWVENRGDRTIYDEDLKKLEEGIPKIWEYNRAAHAGMKNWTEGDANKLVRYGAIGV